MPRKSSTAAVVTEEEPRPARQRQDSLGVEDLSLPRTLVQRLAKGTLPPNTQINKDCLLALSKSATVFISFITASASEAALASGKKTIAPSHVLTALKENQFEAFVARVEAEVNKNSELAAGKKELYKQRVKGRQSNPETPVEGEFSINDEDERPSKKARRDKGAEIEEEQEDEDVEEEEDGEDNEEDEAEQDEEESADDDNDEDEDEEEDSEGDDEDQDPDRIDGTIEDEALDDDRDDSD